MAPPPAPPAPPLPPPPQDVGERSANRRICLVGELVTNEELLKAAESFGYPVLCSKTGEDIAEEEDIVTHYVLPEFEGPLFETLKKTTNCRLLGPTAILQLWKQQEDLPDNVRPLYSISMRQAFICFTGFRVKEELTYLITLIHHMGGSIRKDMSGRVTHLIANSSTGEKYRYATAFRVPVIERAWVERFWNDRHDVDLRAADETLLNEFKLKVFLGSKVCFVGFSDEECQHMTEILLQNGGETVPLEDASCSHVVVANGGLCDNSFPFHSFMHLSMVGVSPISRYTGFKDEGKLNELFSTKLPVLDECGTKNKTKKSNSSSMSFADLNLSESPILKQLFSEDDNIDAITVPSMNSAEGDSKDSIRSKKRSRASIESNFEVDIVKKLNIVEKCEKTDWMSPLKKLKLKESFKFKCKDRPFIKKRSFKLSNKDVVDKMVDVKRDISSDCTVLTVSPDRDDFNTSISSIASYSKLDKSFVSSSGIFDVSFNSFYQSKSKSVSKIRRSMKSITSSFRGERKRKVEKRAKTIDDDSPKQNDTFFDVSPVSNNSFEHLRRISEHNESNNNTANVESKSPVIFKTPKSKVYAKKHRHTLCGPSPVASSPIISSTVNSPINPTLNVGATGITRVPSHKLPPKKRNPETRPNAKNPLDCTVLSVVDEHNTQTLPEVGTTTYVVRAEWFWTSVQNEEAQDEKEYLFEDYLESQVSPSRRSSRDSLSSGNSGAGGTPPHSPTVTVRTPAGSAHSARIRKRKLRLAEGALHKRRSSVGDAVLLSISGNLLDCTQSPDGKQSLLDDVSEVESITVSDAARKHMSPRHQVFMELVQTESNYFGILHTIVTIFKQPLEEMSNEDDPNKALLNNTELKIIFGNLVPIYEIHRRMLEELKLAAHNWNEEINIGRIILKYASDLVKAYPPFVNFFENMKEMLNQCDRDKPRFHAFLKGRQTRPECGRQTLQELLIRPVQRLGSINLLLDDILKHTNKSNPDHSYLEFAIVGLKEVMTYVNEDKRKTEGQRQMFDIYNEIDNCPPHLVSSHRSFVSRCEVVELSKDLSGRGDNLVLFLFTDTMEVCKKKSKVFNSKSPPVNGIHHAASKLGSGKSYRHVQLMPLSTVKRVIDIRESEDCHKVFALMCRSNQELKEKLYSFAITDESVDKTSFLKQLCRQMANTVCKTDAEKFLACLESHQLDIDTSEIALGTLSKAFKFASRTRLKVGRAFSFNKTPSKLKRAVSSMISPFGSTSNLTPASQLEKMKLASCNNINELGVNNSSGQSEVLIAPMSVQPTRKAKATSMSAGVLRR